MPETGTVEFLKLYGILITNQKSDLVRNDLHTKLTPAPRVEEVKPSDKARESFHDQFEVWGHFLI